MRVSRLSRAVWTRARLAMAVLLTLGAVGSFAAHMHRQFDATLARNSRDLESFVSALADHLGGLVQSVDQSLQQLAVRGVHCQPIGIMAQNGALAWARESVRGISGISVLDAQGRIVHSTIPETIGQDRSARPLFKALSSTGASGSSVDVPFRGNISERILIPIGRRLEAAAGEFCGVLVATVAPERLVPFYNGINSNKGRSVWLLQHSNVVARFGGDAESVARDPPSLPTTGSGVVVANQAGTQYFVAYREVEGSGLMIAVSTSFADALADWRKDLFLGASILVVLVGAAFLLHWAQHRHQKVEAARESEMRSQSEARRLLFETSLDIILIVNADQIILHASPSSEAALGIDASLLPGRQLRCVFEAEAMAKLEPELREVRAGRPLRDFETAMATPERSVWISWSGVWSPSEAKYYLIGRDRTELKLREELLVRQNRQLDAALENMSQGLAMFDKDQRIIIANDKFATMYGQDPESVTPGTPLGDIVAHRIKVGIYVDTTVDAILDRMRERVARQKPSFITSKMGDGRTLAVSIQPQPDGGWVTTHLDITDRERLKDRLDAALNNMAQGLVMFDQDYKLVLCNSRYLELYNLPRELGQPGTSALDILRHCTTNGIYQGRDPDAMFASARRRISSDGIGYYETRLSDGRIHGISVRPMREGGLVSTHEDITDRRRIEAQIKHLAHHDALTDIANRVLLRQRLDIDLAAGKPLAVLYLDLDRFKVVNDTLGHSVGDGLLQEVARRLTSSLRAQDMVARLGGDEFAILHYSDDLRVSAKAIAERIAGTLARPFDVAGHVLSIGTSVGIAIAPEDGDDPEMVLKHADLALYAAKTERRGTFSFFDSTMNERLLATQVLEMELRSAIVNQEFFLEYQPIYDLASGEIAACEALVRWQHPRKGRVSPAEFIPLAEQTGLINDVGEWVIRQACREASAWPGDIKVAVNLSPVQVSAHNIVDVVRKALEAGQLPACRLELEITESTLLRDSALTLQVLGQFHAMGVDIALDDFGTGYSSLRYLQCFPFHKIKVDRSFIRAVKDGNPVSTAILRTIAFLGAGLGMVTTVEGVETEDELRFVRAERFNQVQGFFLSKPRLAEQLPWRVHADAA